jgi:hypothetical protein
MGFRAGCPFSVIAATQATTYVGTDPVESTLTETLIKLYTIINLKLFILRCSLQGYGQRLSRRLPTGGGG